MNELTDLLNRMSDSITSKIDDAKEAIKAAEERILSDQQLIDEKTRAIEKLEDESRDFLALLSLFKHQTKVNCEALAALYISDKTDTDFEIFTEKTGIGLAEQTTEEETPQEVSAVA